MKRFGRFASRRLLLQRARRRFGRFVRVRSGGSLRAVEREEGGSRGEDQRAG
jgi:hypothetical protein